MAREEEDRFQCAPKDRKGLACLQSYGGNHQACPHSLRLGTPAANDTRLGLLCPDDKVGMKTLALIGNSPSRSMHMFIEIPCQNHSLKLLAFLRSRLLGGGGGEKLRTVCSWIFQSLRGRGSTARGQGQDARALMRTERREAERKRES